MRRLSLRLNSLLSKPDHPPHLMLKASLTNPLMLRIRLSTPHPKRPLPPMQKSLRLNAAAKRKLTPKPLIFLRAQPLLQRQKNLQRQRPQVKQTLPLQQIRRQIQQPPVSRNQTQHLLTRILRRLNVVESQKLFSHLIHRQTTKPRS